MYSHKCIHRKTPVIVSFLVSTVARLRAYLRALQKVSEGVDKKFISTDLVIIYTRFGRSKPPVCLEISTIASSTNGTSAIIPEKLLKKELTYSSNTL